MPDFHPIFPVARRACPLLALLIMLGCADSAATNSGAPDSQAVAPTQTSAAQTSTTRPAAETPQATPSRVRTAQAGSRSRTADVDRLADSFMQSDDSPDRFKPARVEMHAELSVDDSFLMEQGIRILEGKHVRIYTDLPSSQAVDELPQVFDAIFPQWCAYFDVDPQKNADWSINGVVMKDGDKMRSLGLLPDDLPPFHNGFFRGDTFWVWEQPSDFYRRHLVLHEGTHGFMLTMLGGAGPPWYMEGMAEYFGTHTWDGQNLTTRVIPQAKEDSLMWGRIKIISDDLTAGQGKGLFDIIRYNHEEFLKNRPYGWSWGAVTFLDQHPLTQEAFRKLRKHTRMTGGFSERLTNELGDVWPKVSEQWQIFITDLDYGYQFDASVIDYRPGKPLAGGEATITLSAEKGWQSSEVELTAGTTYQISAEGQFQIKQGPPAWLAEPGGVTLEYYRGQPLGILVGAVRPENPDAFGQSPLAFPQPFGLAHEITPPQTGTLYLKINENPAHLHDNQGMVTVTIKEM